MNERIRQLMVKAICAVDDHADQDDKALQKELKRMYIPNVFVEKFTELVIQDCFWILNKTADNLDGAEKQQRADDLRHAIGSIQEHFKLL